MTAEYFASFCVVQTGDVGPELDAIARLAAECEKRLRYWEILYVVSEGARGAIQGAGSRLSGIRNLRVLMVSNDASYYRRRLVGAAEAIGDVVTLTAPEELPVVDVIGFAEQAMAGNQVIMARRDSRPPLLPVFHWFLTLVSPYRVSARDMHTVAISRARLVDILARPTAAIDLRFEPKRGAFAYERRAAPPPVAAGAGGLSRRFEFFVEIIASSTPSILKAFSLLSLIVLALAIVYGIYAVGVFLFQREVQQGWFSTAVIQSGSVSFIALSFAVVALGVARIAERMDGGVKGVITDELANTSFFERVDDRNVEVQSDAVPHAAPRR